MIEELDELKRHRNQRVARDARGTLRRLWELPKMSGAMRVSDRVSIEVFLDDRQHERLPVNDTEIADRAVYLKELAGREVILAAADYSLLFRARELGLTAVPMPQRAGEADQDEP